MDKAGYRFREDISIAPDVASSEFYEPESGLYVFKKSDGSRRTAAELTDYYVELKKNIPSSPSKTAVRKTTGTDGKS